MRTIAYNVHACTGCGWPDKEAVGHLKEVSMADAFATALGRLEPDIITFSEAPSDSIVQIIGKRLGMQAVSFSSKGEQQRWPGSSWPGALFTRLEMLDATDRSSKYGPGPEELFTRHWGRVMLRTKEGELIVHSAHLYPDASSTAQQREVEKMIQVLREDIKSGRSVLLQGDLNHEPKDTLYEGWKKAGLIDAFLRCGIGPGETTGPTGVNNPTRRLDYIFAHGPIVERPRECRVLSDPPFQLDLGVSKPWSLSDHLPVIAVFE